MAAIVIIGTGAIARGYVADVFERAGHSLIFVGNDRDRMNLATVAHGYEIRLVSSGCEYEGKSRVLRGTPIYAGDNRVLETFNNADVIVSTWSPKDFGELSVILARVIEHRLARTGAAALNVLLVTNRRGDAEALRGQTLERLPSNLLSRASALFGVSAVLVDRIAKRSEDRTVVVAEALDRGFLIDRSSWIGPYVLPPPMPRMTFLEDPIPVFEKKLFTFNMAHAVAALLGYHVGYTSIGQCVRDADIRGVIERIVQALREVIWPHIQTDTPDIILNRFACPRLDDRISRVARNILTKLKPDERLIGPLIRLSAAGRDINDLARGVGAALLYDDAEDSEAREMQRMLKAERDSSSRAIAIQRFLSSHSGLHKHTDIISTIQKHYEEQWSARSFRRRAGAMAAKMRS